MDEQRLQAAERAYAARDFKTAAREYLASVHGDDPEGTGHAYHMAGNALMKLHRYSDAATVYGHASKDPSYIKRGSVLTNLGSALVAAGRPEDAVVAYEEALTDEGYPHPWKSMQGKAGALYKLERYEEAATAYRETAWASGNPDPGKALNNLGLCFMALGRPEEAIEAYKAALGVESYAAKGKAAANLGLAMWSMGFADEALREFEIARDVHGHELVGPMLKAYEAASAACASPAPGSDTVEGWNTGEMPPVFADGEAAWGEADSETEEQAHTFEEDTAFFTMTEDQMRTADREIRATERRERAEGRNIWVTVGIAAGIAIAVIAVVLGLWYSGVGYPTQSATTSGLLDAYRGGKAVDSFWVAAPSVDIKDEMRHLPAEFDSYTIAGVRRGSTSSVVRVTVKMRDRSEPLAYDVLLVREGVGWKVNGIRNAWRSTDQES